MRDLTNGNIYKTFLLFALPIVLSGILSTAYNLIDTMIAGKFLGAHGIAAIGATTLLLEFLSAPLWGYISGFSVYTATLFGAGEFEKIKETLFNNLLIVVIFNILASVLMIIFRDSIFDFLNIDASIRKDAGVYYVIYLLGMPLIILNIFGALAMNSLGLSEYPFRMSMISTLLNITGNILSVTVLNAGVKGIALSSVLAAAIVDIFYFRKFVSCLKELGCTNHIPSFSTKIIKTSFSYSFPVMLQQMIMYASTFLISPVINAIGSSATAAYSVIFRIYNINAKIYQDSSKTLTVYCAQAIGAKKQHLLKKGLRTGFLQGVLFLFPVVLSCFIFANPICRAFFPKGYTGDALSYSVLFLRFFLPFIFFNLINNLFHAFFRGTKEMNYLVILTAIGSISRLVSTLILSPYYAIYGVYAGMVISWICEAVFALGIYCFKVKKGL